MVATIMKIIHAAATTIIIRMAEAAAEDTIKVNKEVTNNVKVVTSNNNKASKDILVSIVDLLVMEI